MVGPLLTLAAAWAGDCSIATDLDRASDAILSLDLATGESALDGAKDGLMCGEVPGDELARFWLLQAAHAEFSGLTERVEPALVAARVTDPDVWVDSLGPDLRARWEAAVPSRGAATLDLTDLPEGYVATLDGAPFTGDLTPGFHILQVGGGEQGFGKVVRASSGDAVQLSTQLPPLPIPEPVVAPMPPPIERPEPSSRRLTRLHLAVGATAAFGDSFATEPPTKVGPALELGVGMEPIEPLWIRLAVAGEVSLGGRWAYAEGTQTKGLAVSPSVLLSAGARLGDVRVGAQGGLQLPGRLPIRILGGYAFSDVIGAELRGGVNLRRLTSGETKTEPALSAHLTVDL